MRFLLLLLVLGACARPDRELAQCTVVADGMTNALARCLILQYNWDSASATRAELHHDAGIRRAERAAQARRDSVAIVRTRRALAAAQRRDSIEVAYAACVSAALAWWKANPSADLAAYRKRADPCESARVSK